MRPGGSAGYNRSWIDSDAWLFKSVLNFVCPGMFHGRSRIQSVFKYDSASATPWFFNSQGEEAAQRPPTTTLRFWSSHWSLRDERAREGQRKRKEEVLNYIMHSNRDPGENARSSVCLLDLAELPVHREKGVAVRMLVMGDPRGHGQQESRSERIQSPSEISAAPHFMLCFGSRLLKMVFWDLSKIAEIGRTWIDRITQ